MTQSLVWWLVGALYWHGTPANITAVCLSSIPAFMITRRWVWNCRQSKASLRRQAGVFWAMSLAGLVISTILATAMFMVYPHAWAVSLANLAGFGLLWFVRFFVLDHYLFAAQ